MKNKSLSKKIILSSATVVVLLGILALSTGAQKATDKTTTASSTASAIKAEAVKTETVKATTMLGTDTTSQKKEEIKTEMKNEIKKTEETKSELPAATPAEVASYLEAYGWMVGQQAGFEMGFAPEEKAAIMRGLERAAAGEKAADNMKEIFPKMQEYLSAKEKAYRAKMLAKQADEAKVHLAEGEKFLAGIAKQEGVKKSDSGLYYKISTPGTGAQPTAEDVVTVHYTGKLIDGTVFDSSIERGQPVDLPLYGVIPGFSEGLRLLKEGGKATLYIPSTIGYGNQAAGPIPSGSTLVFEVELIKVQPKAAAESAPVTTEEKKVVAEDDKGEKTEKTDVETKAQTQD